MKSGNRQSILRWMLKHYLYLGILAFVIAFAVVPMHGIMKMNTVREAVNSWVGEPMRASTRYAYTQDMSRGFLLHPINLEMTCAIFGGIGFGSALLLFGHLFSRKQSMMYAQMPLTKDRDFLLRSGSFLILVQAPVLLCTAIYPLAVLAGGMEAFFDGGLYLREAIVLNMTVLFGYGVGALSAQLFGTLWAAILGGAVLGASAEAVFLSWNMISWYYLQTRVPEKATRLMVEWSPLVSLYKGLYKAESFHWFPASAGIVILILLAWRTAVRNRPERAGNTLNLEIIEKPGRAWVTILGGSVCGWLFAGLLGTEHSLYIGLAAGALAAALAARMLKEQNIRVSLKGWAIPAACACVLILAALGLRMDIAGFDRYQPAAEEIKSVSYAYDSYGGSEAAMTRFREPENVDAAREWTEALLKQSREERAKTPFRRMYGGIRIQWEKQDGSVVSRLYQELEDSSAAAAALKTLADSAEYRNQRAEGIPAYAETNGTGILHFNAGMQEEEFREVYGFSPRIAWEKIKAQPLREALAEDMRERTWEEMQGILVGTVYFSEENEDTWEYRTSEGYPVYAGDERTIRVLFGDRAEQVISYLKGGWAEKDEMLVFRCEAYSEGEEGEGWKSFRLASSPEEAKAWMAEATGCQDKIFEAPTGKYTLRIVSRTAVRRWAENQDLEDLLAEEEFWKTLPERDDLYIGTSLPVRAKTE